MAIIETINGYQGQIIYQDFKNNKNEIQNLIHLSSIIPSNKPCLISRIGIQAIPGDRFKFENRSSEIAVVEIGKTGFYEANEVEIVHIQYIPKKKDTNSNEDEERSGHDVIIDYIIKEGV